MGLLEGGFIVRVELRDFGSECEPSIWERALWTFDCLVPTRERLVMLTCYTPEGYYVGDLDTAIRIYGAWGLTDVQPVAAAVGEAAGKYMLTDEIVDRKLTCALGFDPERQKWVGWSHRATAAFGVGHIVEGGDCGARSRIWSVHDGPQPPPSFDLRVPVGFECKTLDDARWCAIAFADSVA